MNAPVSLSNDPFAAAYARALERVNAWRGRCLANFASAEVEVTKTLIALAATNGSVSLGQLFGQRLGALEKLICGDDGCGVGNSLAAFLTHERLRAFLAHGEAKVTIDRSERWQAVFTTIAIKRRQPHTSFIVVDELEAKAIVSALGKDRQRFVDCLLQWRNARLPLANSSEEVTALRIGEMTS